MCACAFVTEMCSLTSSKCIITACASCPERDHSGTYVRSNLLTEGITTVDGGTHLHFYLCTYMFCFDGGTLGDLEMYVYVIAEMVWES